MDSDKLLKELLLLPTEERTRFFALLKARPTLQRELRAANDSEPEMAPTTHTSIVTVQSDADYVIAFDGGARGNPGPGYGSYAVTAVCSGKQRIERLEFGNKMTNNEAEYDTLITAIQTLAERIEATGKSPQGYTLEIRGDSELVIRQISGQYKAKNPRMAARRDKALLLLARFKRYTLTHHDRSNSVALFGH